MVRAVRDHNGEWVTLGEVLDAADVEAEHGPWCRCGTCADRQAAFNAAMAPTCQRCGQRLAHAAPANACPDHSGYCADCLPRCGECSDRAIEAADEDRGWLP